MGRCVGRSVHRGASYRASKQPLAAFTGDLMQLGNLTHNSGRAPLDGAGDHGRSAGSYLTGIQVKKSTVEIRGSISCDQIVANRIGSQRGSGKPPSSYKNYYVNLSELLRNL